MSCSDSGIIRYSETLKVWGESPPSNNKGVHMNSAKSVHYMKNLQCKYHLSQMTSYE